MKNKRVLNIVIGLIIAAVAYYVKSINGEPETSDSFSEITSKVEKSQISTDDSYITSDAGLNYLKVARVTDSSFTVLKNCTLVMKKYGNDGDSFEVKHSQGKTEFRLYFMDACESWLSKYNADRLAEQGDYFGGMSQEDTIKAGVEAKNFVIDLLQDKPFTVVTKWENVYGPDRKYAFVLVDFEGESRYLHEILAAKGLARIHTKTMTLPDSTSSSRQREYLKKLQNVAKKAKVGAWKF